MKGIWRFTQVCHYKHVSLCQLGYELVEAVYAHIAPVFIRLYTNQLQIKTHNL